MAGMRVFAKIADLFVQEHYVVSEHLIKELAPLKLKKGIKVLIDPPLYPGKYEKQPHKGFNVLYYRGIGANQKFNDWVYGYDIFLKVKRMYTDVNFIEVNGGEDMTNVYPIIDFYLRPNRHDGAPRMIMECENNGIPYYWSKCTPVTNTIIQAINESKNTNSLRNKA